MTYEPMNQEVKPLLVTALRSGKYTQTRERLSDNIGHCCLGVLCDIHNSFFKDGRWHDYEYFYNGVNSIDIPSKYILEWAGLSMKTAVVLAEMNDDRDSNFNMIAGWIEENL